MENHEQSQEFSSFDILSILLCFSLIVVISGLFVKNHIQQSKVKDAKVYAENLAQKLVSDSVIYSQEGGLRLPASEQGESLDPWGSPFQYSVIKNSYGQPIYMIVTSGGPNKKIESHFSEAISYDKSSLADIQFDGDDIGYIKSYR